MYMHVLNYTLLTVVVLFHISVWGIDSYLTWESSISLKWGQDRPVTPDELLMKRPIRRTSLTKSEGWRLSRSPAYNNEDTTL